MCCCSCWISTTAWKEISVPGGTSGKESANSEDLRDLGSISGLGRSPGGGHGNPLQYSCLENPIDRGPWRAAVRGVAKSQTWLNWLNTHSLQGNQGEEQKWSTLCSGGKNGITGLQIVRYIQGLISWAQFLYLLISRKALKSCMLMTVPHDYRNLLQKICAWLQVLPLHQNHIYTDPYLSGAVSRSWVAVSWAVFLILPQIKPDYDSHIVHLLKANNTGSPLKAAETQWPMSWHSCAKGCGFSQVPGSPTQKGSFPRCPVAAPTPSRRVQPAWDGGLSVWVQSIGWQYSPLFYPLCSHQGKFKFRKGQSSHLSRPANEGMPDQMLRIHTA